MDMNKLIGAGNLTPMDLLPEPLRPIIEALLDGRMRSLMIITEEVDTGTGDLFMLDMDDKASNVFALVGALEHLKRDLMDLVPSRRELENERDDDNE